MCSQERQQTDKQQLSVLKKDNKEICNNYPGSQEIQQTNTQQLSVHKKENKHKHNYLFTRNATIRCATIILVHEERQQTDKQQLPLHKKDNKQISNNYPRSQERTTNR